MNENRHPPPTPQVMVTEGWQEVVQGGGALVAEVLGQVAGLSTAPRGAAASVSSSAKRNPMLLEYAPAVDGQAQREVEVEAEQQSLRAAWEVEEQSEAEQAHRESEWAERVQLRNAAGQGHAARAHAERSWVTEQQPQHEALLALGQQAQQRDASWEAKGQAQRDASWEAQRQAQQRDASWEAKERAQRDASWEPQRQAQQRDASWQAKAQAQRDASWEPQRQPQRDASWEAKRRAQERERSWEVEQQAQREARWAAEQQKQQREAEWVRREAQWAQEKAEREAEAAGAAEPAVEAEAAEADAAATDSEAAAAEDEEKDAPLPARSPPPSPTLRKAIGDTRDMLNATPSHSRENADESPANSPPSASAGESSGRGGPSMTSDAQGLAWLRELGFDSGSVSPDGDALTVACERGEVGVAKVSQGRRNPLSPVAAPEHPFRTVAVGTRGSGQSQSDGRGEG